MFVMTETRVSIHKHNMFFKTCNIYTSFEPSNYLYRFINTFCLPEYQLTGSCKLYMMMFLQEESLSRLLEGNAQFKTVN